MVFRAAVVTVTVLWLVGCFAAGAVWVSAVQDQIDGPAVVDRAGG